MSAVDIHCMPGGYASEVMDQDVRAAAIFDRGTFLNVCGTQGAMHDARGRTAVAYLLTEHADLKPARILDMGCSVGQATLPYATYYPHAEVHAIDVAAPLLRYAHARAESVGRAVHFSQQNAERTDFPKDTSISSCRICCSMKPRRAPCRASSTNAAGCCGRVA